MQAPHQPGDHQFIIALLDKNPESASAKRKSTAGWIKPACG